MGSSPNVELTSSKKTKKSIFKWASQVRHKISTFTRDSSLGNELPYPFLKDCVTLRDEYQILSNIMILLRSVVDGEEKYTALQVLITPTKINKEGSNINLHNQTSQMQILGTPYKSFPEGFIFCSAVDSTKLIKNKLIMDNQPELQYECFHISEDEHPKLVFEKTEPHGFPFPKGSDHKDSDSNARKEALAKAFRKIVIASRSCYISGIHGITIAVILGVGETPFWNAEKIEETFEIRYKNAINVLIAADVLLELGTVTAEVLLHNSDPLSSGAPAGRIAIGQFKRIVQELNNNAFTAFTDSRKHSSLGNPDYNLITSLILRNIGKFSNNRKKLIEELTTKHSKDLLVLASWNFDEPIWNQHLLDKEDSQIVYDKFNKSPKWLIEILPLLDERIADKVLESLKKKIKYAKDYDDICEIWQAAIVGARWPQNEEFARKCIKILFDCYDKYETSISKTTHDQNAPKKMLFLIGNLLSDSLQNYYYQMYDSRSTLERYANKFVGRPESYLEYKSRDDFPVSVKNKSDTKISQNGDQGIILIASQKGGVGKSTIALSIANELSKKERVLLVEMDFGGSTLGYLANSRGVFSNYETTNYVLLEDEVNNEHLAKMWRPDKKKKLFILPSPLDHEKQRELIAHLIWPTLRESFEKRLKDLLKQVGSMYSKIILDLPAEFGAEGMAAFRNLPSGVKSLLFIVGRASFNTIAPTFEWANIYGIGKMRKVALVVNKVPVVSQDFWNTGHGLADNIYYMRKHEINGFPKAKHSCYIHALMPWKDIFVVPDIPYLREIASLSDVERASEYTELQKIFNFTRTYFDSEDKNE